MPTEYFNIQGLTTGEVVAARAAHGINKLEYKKEQPLLNALKGLAKEPMVILLLVAASIYFMSEKTADGIFLVCAVILVSTISLYQDSRSRNAMEKLKNFTQPACRVIRNGIAEEIRSEDLVVGDALLVDEGALIPADGIIVHANDFSVNESVLTGESMPVFKDQTNEDNHIYSGTTVASGLAIATVTAIGNQSKLGQIGKSLESIKEEKTPLELQVRNFVKKMAFAGVAVFIIVWVINYSHSRNIPDSLLKSLTLAMSILPEEIPVAFTTFMALGAWRLMKLGVVVKQMKTVETLGSATVICTDKTGTITENKMSIAGLFTLTGQQITGLDHQLTSDEKELIRIAMWASEPIPFDPMETALHTAYARQTAHDERPYYKMAHEYPLDGKPPMMTHIFEDKTGQRIIAAKGAPEAFINISGLSPFEQTQVQQAVTQLAAKGYRVLAVGQSRFSGTNFPPHQQDFKFAFKGLVAFYDPPKKNIGETFNAFYQAGIKVKIVTGDNPITTTAIASQVGFRGYDKAATGDELMNLSEPEIVERVAKTNIFTRMFPDAKLRIINALKANKEIVAMTGDGVNDGPALKAAHIGIAMGTKGSEIAKQAASLILCEDDLSKMVDAVAMGRRIYSNLKKAIQYIISIHVAVILTVFTPLALGWVYPNIFSPLHIIFFELIMGPTCSIIYENEPIEQNLMSQQPRPYSVTFFSWRELATSILQGLVAEAGTLLVYQYAVAQGYDEALTRTMVFVVLVSANIFLTLVNRSFYYSMFTTLKYKNNLVPLIITITVAISAVLINIKPVADFFLFKPLNWPQFAISAITGFVFVVWYELVKWRKRRLNTSK